MKIWLMAVVMAICLSGCIDKPNIPTPKAATPVRVVHKRSNSGDVNMDIIIRIESNGNPNAIGRAGEHGLCQIIPGTWDECIERMGVDWSWKEYSFDPIKNRAVGTYYMNTRIPQMLRYYDIPDTIDNRIIAYNAGIGNLIRIHREVNSIPYTTCDYLAKYRQFSK